MNLPAGEDEHDFDKPNSSPRVSFSLLNLMIPLILLLHLPLLLICCAYIIVMGLRKVVQLRGWGCWIEKVRDWIMKVLWEWFWKWWMVQSMIPGAMIGDDEVLYQLKFNRANSINSYSCGINWEFITLLVMGIGEKWYVWLQLLYWFEFLLELRGNQLGM